MKRVASFLVAAGLVCAVAARASAAPPSNDPKSAAADAASWLASTVNASGFIPQTGNPAQANFSTSAQAVTALAAAGVGKTKVDAMMAYLGQHVDDFVVHNSADDPGSLSYLILAAEATGADPTSFGTAHTNLVSRLLATQQPSGLFGASDPTFDGAFREGISLLALHAAGVANASGVSWLKAQQCADGSWTSYRADVNVACPAVDPVNFTGPDTNSTALAVLGLHAQGETTPVANGVTALDAVRNAGGGWGFLSSSDQATDANSTGLVVTALHTATGSPDAKGEAALLELQAGCSAPAPARGGIAFQPGAGGVLTPDALATAQATPALAEVSLPLQSPSIATGVPDVCPSSVTGQGGTSTTTSTVAAAGKETSSGELPRTGTSSAPLAIIALVCVGGGVALAVASRRRRA